MERSIRRFLEQNPTQSNSRIKIGKPQALCYDESMSENSGGKQLTRKQILAKIGLGAIGGTAAAIGGTAAIMKGAELVGAAVQGVVNARDNRASEPSVYTQAKEAAKASRRFNPPTLTPNQLAENERIKKEEEAFRLRVNTPNTPAPLSKPPEASPAPTSTTAPTPKIVK